MTGHRTRQRSPLRSETRNTRWRQRIAAAESAEQAAEVAFDWLRSSCHHPDIAEA
jgi:hypothetical protein